MMRFFREIYLNKSVFIILGICIVFFSFGLLYDVFFLMGKILILALFIVAIVEIILLWNVKNPVQLSRKLPVRLSNGDENFVEISIHNLLNMNLIANIIEELPVQLQLRNWQKTINLPSQKQTDYSYKILPKTRGIYLWENCILLIQLVKYSLVSRKITFELHQETACYPSFEQFKKIPLKATVNNFKENNSENFVRKIGQSLEFEQIKEYSQEDDYRHINWKASAKSGKLMLNQYQEERSQDIYAVIDLGRTMKMAFNQQTLLDYAVNAGLALSKAVISMNDKAGIIGLAHNNCQFLPAKKDIKQFGKINDFLYNIRTDFLEANYEFLYKFARVNLRQRSLLVIFKNFDSVNALNRELPYLKAIAKYHLVLMIFFENSEIAKLVEEKAVDLLGIYEKTIGQNMLNQNRLIAKELQMNGIQSICVEPEKLSLATINKFVEIKKRQIL
jgi:uncharacterized protein (DUF58 family)